MAQSEVSQLLAAWTNGDARAIEQLTPLVYGELKRLSAAYMRNERPDHTLQPTAVVHELFIRLVRREHPDWKNRAHFFAIAGKLIRQILVDHARARRASKRGGLVEPVPLDSFIAIAPNLSESVLDIDHALTALQDVDARKARLVELRYFGGMQIEEIADLLDLSAATVYRELRLAEAWLHRRVRGKAAKASVVPPAERLNKHALLTSSA